MTKQQFFGYHPENLPFKKDDFVKIRKGTLYYHRGELVEAKTTYSVKVHHVCSGSSIAVGNVWKSGEVDFKFSSRGGQYIFEEKYGVRSPTEIWPLLRVSEYGTIFAPLSNPMIVWAGRGGYWSEADINQFDF